MKRFLFISFLLCGIFTPLPSYPQDNPKIDYTMIDRQIKQFASILIHDGEDLEKISSDLIETFLSMDSDDQRRWHLQSTIHSINEIAKTMEHEALLINIGLDYVNENEKLLFYNNILKIRVEQYRKEINLSLELLMSKNYLITDNSVIDNINKAKEICQNILNLHDRHIKTLKSI